MNMYISYPHWIILVQAWHVISIVLQDAVEGLIQNEAKRKDDDHTTGVKTVPDHYIFTLKLQNQHFLLKQPFRLMCVVNM